MHGRRRWIVIVVAILVVAVGGWFLFGRGSGAPKQAGAGAGGAGGPPGQGGPPPIVPVFPVQPQTVPVHREYVSTTRAINTTDIKARVAGYLVKRAFKEGDDVEAGALLYQIDPRDYQAQVDRAQSQVTADEANLAYSKANAGRVASLARDGFETRDNADRVTATQRQGEATVALDRANLRAAQLNLEYTTIRAPFAGRIGRTLVDQGGLITQGDTTLNTLVQLDPIYAYFTPREQDWADIAKYRAAGPLKAELLMGQDGEAKLTGTLDFVANLVDNSTGTVEMRAIFQNAQKTVLPGQFARVRLTLTDRPDALLIPQRAIGSDQTGKFVYVVGPGNTVVVRPVTLGDSYGQMQLVENGLHPGDQVATEALQALRPGQVIQPQLPGQPAPAQPPPTPAHGQKGAAPKK